MANKQQQPFLIFFIICCSFSPISSASCPINFTYVETTPWDTSGCRNITEKGHCCDTLLSLFGMGLAQHLRETSMFQLPNTTSQASCLSDFQAKLTSIPLDSSLASTCFNNPIEFVSNVTSCVGIVSTQDWTNKLGHMTALDSSCNGDVSGLTQCSSCLEAGNKVMSQLTRIDPNNSLKCFHFTCLYAAGIVNDFGPLDAMTAGCILGLPLTSSVIKKSSNSLEKNRSLKLVFGLIGAGIGAFLASGIIMWYRRREKKRRLNASHEEYVSSIRSSILPNSGAKWFRFSELERATNGFSTKNFIGQGSYGIVYKGTLVDGTIIAVKQMQDFDSQGDEEFSNEVEIISKVRHKNLLSLRGCCVTSDHMKGNRRFLVYDFMSNGSLNDHLSNDQRRIQLTWPQRKNIVLDVAKGIAYLHYGLKPAIYHRDIKSTNILLDKEMHAKVGDFGLAKQSLEGQSHLTTRVAGTHGYLAPEYALYGQLTEKSDVYSFGIMILEIMSGRKVLDTSSTSVILITDWAWMLIKSRKMEEIFDKSIREQGPKGVMERYVLVGILCAHVMVAFRPTIADALRMLEGDIDIPKLPDRPMPLSHESFRYPFNDSVNSRMSSSGMNLV